MSKAIRRVVVVLIIAVAIGAMGWLVVRWNQASRRSLTVTNAGPLEVSLWGIRPNAGDTIYDGGGREIRRTPGITLDEPHWSDDSQRFDFIFELPRSDQVPLFTTFPGLEVSGEGRHLGGSFGKWISDSEDKRLLWLRTSFPRTFRRSVLRGLWTRQTDVDSVDITLEYYHGPAAKFLFAFKGPFRLSSMVGSEDGVYNLVCTRDSKHAPHGYTEFELTTSNLSDAISPVIVYDNFGGRYLTETAGASSNQQSRKIRYRVRGIAVKKISAIALGEQPHRVTFKNINLNASGVGELKHATYLDEMASRLNLKLDPKKLTDYRFQDANDAIDVIDIVRGRHIVLATETILYNAGRRNRRQDPLMLRDDQKQEIKHAASQWLKALDPEIKAAALQLGLTYSWADFVDPALELLETRPMPHDFKMSQAQSKASYALQKYGYKLSDNAVSHIKDILLSRDDRNIFRDLRNCLTWSKTEGRIDALLELAEDDRAWLWWFAIDRLGLWKQFDGKARALPHKLRLRLYAVRGWHDYAATDQIAPKAYEMLAGVMTPELASFDSGTFNNVLLRLARNADRSLAIKAFIDFLRRLEEHDRFKYSIDKMVKYINLWHELRIGGLGTDPARSTANIDGHDWSEAAAEAIEWYESTQDANDTASDVQ